MSVTIDKVIINRHCVEAIQGFPREHFHLEGKGTDDEIKGVCNALREYNVGDTVQVKDEIKFNFSGVWKIGRLELTQEGKTPIIYKFYIGFWGLQIHP